MSNQLIVAAWIMAHAFFVPACVTEKLDIKALSSIVGVSLIAFVLISKPNTYDLKTYLDYFDAPYLTDIGFYIASLALSALGLESGSIMLCFQVSIFIVMLLVMRAMEFRSLSLDAVFLVLGSLFFILASQNILRQGLSVSLALLGYLRLIHGSGRRVTNLALVCVAVSFHFWTVILLVLASCEVIARRLIHGTAVRGFFGTAALGAIVGLLALLVAGRIGVSDNYLDSAFDWDGNRSSVMLKAVSYGGMFVLLHFPLRRLLWDDRLLSRIYSMRVLVFFFSLPLLVYSEVFSRVQVFYYAIEFLIFCRLYAMRGSLARYCFLVLVFAYAIAPNVWNILTLDDF